MMVATLCWESYMKLKLAGSELRFATSVALLRTVKEYELDNVPATFPFTVQLATT